MKRPRLMLLLLFAVLMFLRAFVEAEVTKNRLNVYWSYPSEKCNKLHNVTIPLDEYGVIHNTDNKFLGEKIITFYEYKTALFPYFQKYKPDLPVNDGLPQKMNLAAHLEAFEKHVNFYMPDAEFDGPACIDVEEWRPSFKLNWAPKDVYRNESIKLVQQKNPSLSWAQATPIATKEFDDAAKDVFLRTLRLAKQMRPRAQWGFYGFPYCNYDAGAKGELACNDVYIQHNNDLQWLYAEVSALYPSIYVSRDEERNPRYMYAIMAESRRVASVNSGNRSKPLLINAFTKFEYDPYKPLEEQKFYSPRDMCYSLQAITDLGGDSALIWSTDTSMTADRCDRVADVFRQNAGSFFSLATYRSQQCADRACSGHGKCIARSYPPVMCGWSLNVADYSCICDEGFTGMDCSQSTSNSSSSTTLAPSVSAGPSGLTAFPFQPPVFPAEDEDCECEEG